MACVGTVQETTLPLDIYIAGSEMEGFVTLVAQGQIVYLNGPKISSLKAGMIQRVVRPEAKIHDPLTGKNEGFYYKDIGTIRIETVEGDKAIARVQSSCHGMAKGDLVVPYIERSTVEFNGTMSSEVTMLSEKGLVGSILFAKDDDQQLAAGKFCFLDLGKRDGIKPGDRFTVFRTQPGFNSMDLANIEMGGNTSYHRMTGWEYRHELSSVLRQRKLPPRILGDVIAVDVKEGVTIGKVVNSLSEIHLGDLIVKR
jgi:hypothetical protein